MLTSENSIVIKIKNHNYEPNKNQISISSAMPDVFYHGIGTDNSNTHGGKR